jgi:hypothetical protein
MKTIYLKSLVAAALIPLGFLACKDDDKMEASLTVESLAGTYKLTALTQETALTPKVSIMNLLDDCMLDDEFVLKTDTTASYHDAGVSCNPANNYDFDYQITSTAVKLFWQHADLFPGGKVEKWDGKTLVLSTKVKNDYTQNIEMTITGTLTRK